MKIAVSSTGPTLDHLVGLHFRHCGYLLLIDPQTMQYEAIVNPIIALRGPAAGILFRQLLAQESITALLTGNCEAAVFKTLAPAGIHVIAGICGTVRRVVERFNAHELLVAS